MILALVLLSALLHATWNALLRVERDRDRALVAAVGVAMVLAAIVAGVRWAFGEAPFDSAAALGWTIAAGVLEWLYFASLAKALDRGALGPVYTISRGGAILLVWPISIAMFAERLTLPSAIGSAVVFGGLALASSGTGDARHARRDALASSGTGDARHTRRDALASSGTGDARHTRRDALASSGTGDARHARRDALARSGTGDARHTRRDALAWAIACATSIAGYHLAYKAALRSGGSASAVFAVALAVATAINLVRIGDDGRRACATLLRTRLPRLVMMGIFCGGSFLILMEALAAGGAGYVLTLRNTSVLFATALAFAIGERPRHAEIAGATFVAAGAILMAW